MRCFLAILLALLVLSLRAQNLYGPFTKFASSARTFFPTNVTSGGLVWWGDLTPINGTWTGAGNTTHPAADNQNVGIWTNFASGSGWPIWGNAGTVWTADQTLHPTNFVSGGGGHGTSPRLFFQAATSERMVTSGWPVVTNKATIIMVANCTATSGIDSLFENGAGTPLAHYNAKKLEMTAGTTLSSAATMGTGFYIISFIFASDATSHIDTNGVMMVTGNAGSGNMGAVYLMNESVTLHGNISRFWAWNGILSAADLQSAVTQCGLDFGITTPWTP